MRLRVVSVDQRGTDAGDLALHGFPELETFLEASWATDFFAQRSSGQFLPEIDAQYFLVFADSAFLTNQVNDLPADVLTDDISSYSTFQCRQLPRKFFIALSNISRSCL